MREIQFVKKNNAKWQKFESVISNKKNADPDELADLYIQAMDDLSFARTFFPNTKVFIYLNQLSAKIHQEIFKNKKENYKRIITFWTREVPEAFYYARKHLLAALIITIIAGLIGALSSANDDTFVRLILSDGYVNRTIANIKSGDPMAIYKSASSNEMFLGITLNNVMVSFKAYVFGVFFSIGSVYALFQNGVMLGSFLSLFTQYDLSFVAFKTIWIHGVLEISSILMAGAAGMLLGTSFMFPKTLSRKESFRRGAKTSLKIIIGLVPIFICAGFLESFITRLTEMPDWLSLLIIGLSFIFIICYFVVYPTIIHKKKEALHAGLFTRKD